MNNKHLCTAAGCDVKITLAIRLYDGEPYCDNHYTKILYRDLTSEFNAWQAGHAPPDRFKYLLGRISDEFRWNIEGDSYLTAARVRDRGFDFTKSETGCVFKITRHPGAFKSGSVTHRVVQTWQADLAENGFGLSIAGIGWQVTLIFNWRQPATVLYLLLVSIVACRCRVRQNVGQLHIGLKISRVISPRF